jgi:protein-S-isoprenylcysteine O-methyltransferase Ste14
LTGHSIPTVVLICVSFVFVHSLMVSKWLKRGISRVLGERFVKCYYRFSFTIFSGVALIVIFILILGLPDVYLFHAPLWLKVPMHVIQVSGMLFGMMSLLVLDTSEFFGIRQMTRCRGKKNPDMASLSIDGVSPVRLAKTGVYSIVRHPIYLAGIVMISFQPDITYNRLVVMFIADLYFISAAFKEERHMLKKTEIGYHEYMRNVPMFNVFKGIYRTWYQRGKDHAYPAR